MAYKTTDQIISVVFSLLRLLPVNRYSITKPTKAVDTEYIVINSLPINADVMQKCYVNVNYHVKDLANGTPDQTKLQSGAESVLNILSKVSTATYLIDFESQETFREEALKEHFSNLRFSFKNINT